MTNVLLYSRNATEESSFSLSSQEEMMIKYCNENNYNIIKSYKEIYSGKTFNRPEWNLLKSFIMTNQKKIDKILVLTHDRFCRNHLMLFKELEILKRLGVTIEVVNHSDTDKILLETLYQVLPKIEKEVISKRTKEGIYRARLKGCFTSKAPFGYYNSRINFNSTLKFSKQSDLVKKAFTMIVKENKCLAEVREMFNKNGFNKSAKDVKSILKNRTYIGQILVPAFKCQEEKFVKGLHKPLISNELFFEASRILNV